MIQINRLDPIGFLIIKSYLSVRHFQTRVGDAFSDLTKTCASETLVADCADDKAIISINNDPVVAPFNLQNHLAQTEELYTKWRLNINQSKSVHTTFTLRLARCTDVFVYIVLTSPSSLRCQISRNNHGPRHIRSKRLHLNSRLRSLKTIINNNKFTHIRHQISNLQISSQANLNVWPLWGNTKKI